MVHTVESPGPLTSFSFQGNTRCSYASAKSYTSPSSRPSANLLLAFLVNSEAGLGVVTGLTVFVGMIGAPPVRGCGEPSSRMLPVARLCALRRRAYRLC